MRVFEKSVPRRRFETNRGRRELLNQKIHSTPYLIYNIQVIEDKIRQAWVCVEYKKNVDKVFTGELEGKGTQKTYKWMGK
jgi:hypothetical protein